MDKTKFLINLIGFLIDFPEGISEQIEFRVNSNLVLLGLFNNWIIKAINSTNIANKKAGKIRRFFPPETQTK